MLRLFCLHDSAIQSFLRPFWSDHKGNAIRSFQQLVNDKSNPDNMVANHPDQFTLFELGTFNPETGEIQTCIPQSLGNGVEFIKKD